MMADVMSRGALSATDQQVAPISKHQTAPMKNQCRRLHDTKINHAGSTTQEQMSQRTLFKGNKFIIFRSDHVSNRIRNPRTNRSVQCSLSSFYCRTFKKQDSLLKMTKMLPGSFMDPFLAMASSVFMNIGHLGRRIIIENSLPF